MQLISRIQESLNFTLPDEFVEQLPQAYVQQINDLKAKLNDKISQLPPMEQWDSARDGWNLLANVVYLALDHADLVKRINNMQLDFKNQGLTSKAAAAPAPEGIDEKVLNEAVQKCVAEKIKAGELFTKQSLDTLVVAKEASARDEGREEILNKVREQEQLHSTSCGIWRRAYFRRHHKTFDGAKSSRLQPMLQTVHSGHLSTSLESGFHYQSDFS
ncbi:MAG: hypothetical protein M2R45_05045 [Verrucomicrobia subdivision 3 bacterium]|nr:hypothetical protein [Limisphaerales bacterium]MCS1412552.1 hypothetical protein [Limisphaerales bacterium]